MEDQVKQDSQEDIVSRVAQPEPPKTEEVFNVDDIEKIEDPKAKEYAQKAYKSFERGYQKKFQDLAEQRKSLETKLTESTKWSPEKIQGLLQDPEFVKSAQAVAGNQTEPEESPIAIENKKKIRELEAQIAIENARRQDDVLRTKYKDYSPQEVDSLVEGLLSGKIRPSREDLWKFLKSEAYIKRAYELGKQDRKLDVTEKIESSSVEGITATPGEEKPKKLEGESDEAYFKRIALHNLAVYQKAKTQPKKE